MNRALAAFIALLVPRSAFGEIVVGEQFDHPDGRDRLALYTTMDPLFWRLLRGEAREPDPQHPGQTRPARGRAGEPHCLVWQQQSGGRWRTRARISAWRLRRAAGGGSLVQVHSIDPDSGVAIILLRGAEKRRPARMDELPQDILDEVKKRGFPLEGVQISEGSFAWTSWDMRRNRRVAVLQKVSGPFDAFDG